MKNPSRKNLSAENLLQNSKEYAIISFGCRSSGCIGVPVSLLCRAVVLRVRQPAFLFTALLYSKSRYLSIRLQENPPRPSKKRKNLLTKQKKHDILTLQKIEAHLDKSSRRETACAGVAVEKGLGAEGRFCARSILALRKISAMLSQKCGALSTPVHNRPNGGFYGQGYALWRTPAFHYPK